MGKDTAARHTKRYYLAFCTVAEVALAAALFAWVTSPGARRPEDFGTEMPGVSWGLLLVTAIVITATAGGLTVLASAVPPALRWTVGLAGAASAGALAPVALQLMVRPSSAALLVAVGMAGMGVSMTGMVRARFLREPANPAGHSA
ncbi:hypothetical protein ABZ454_35195 [Streptomyces sp. NPDC005803]|uniref:hypothetical protein n=1 Tax=Streptomyces sp. NPDC005803 TaxID=3154297 RepID=UPI00340F69FA